MQAIAGIHFNYSFSLEFWQSYRELISPKDTDSKGFMDIHYMGLTRNVLRYGWLIPYLFGASATVCKSFMHDYHEHNLEEFDDNTLYLPYATSLRMGDIGYQNSQEDEKGVKANYNSLCHYIYSLRAAMKTNCEDFEKIGVKKNGEYQQLNTNILQIANEYYSSVRPKPILGANDRPLRALNNNGIGYIEVRSLDINPMLEVGIDKQQIEFLEAFLLFCLLEDSPAISSSELVEIDSNALLVAHQGRKPGLMLGHNGEDVLLSAWGESLFGGIKQCSKLLSSAHQESVESISARIKNPDLTPSAIMLNEMSHQEIGFFEFTNQFSRKYKIQNQEKTFDKASFHKLDELAINSIKEQLEAESNDVISFDQFLEDYFEDDV
jgi:glutamate--cysteine ligase